MKRITEIFRALRVLSRTPSKTIADAWTLIKGHNAGDGRTHGEALVLIDNIITAVTAHAAEDEAKQAAAAAEVQAP